MRKLIALIFISLLVVAASCCPATLTEEDAQWATYDHLHDIATTPHGLLVLAAYEGAAWYGGTWPANELTSHGWIIYDAKYAHDIDQEPLLAGLFDGLQPEECYGFAWLVRFDGDVMPTGHNALVLEATIKAQ